MAVDGVGGAPRTGEAYEDIRADEEECAAGDELGGAGCERREQRTAEESSEDARRSDPL